MKAFIDKLFSPINPIHLGIFRIGLGLLFMFEAAYFMSTYLVEDYLMKPKYLFNYDFLPLNPLEEGPMKAIIWAMFLAGALIALGLWQRIAAFVYFISLSYIFLLEKVFYNNHIYLFALIALMLVFIPADAALSIKSKRANQPIQGPLGWHIWLLRFQLMVVYFFGGVAKINYDWLTNLEPTKTLLAAKGITSDFAIYFITYGGMVFDLTIGFMLLWKRTRLLGMIGVIVFNLSNHYLFDDINIFPFFMLFATIVFLDSETVGQWVSKRFKNIKIQKEFKPYGPNYRKIAVAALGVYVLFQLWMPLRHLMFDSNVDWSGEGQRFAWRMKIQTRTVAEMKFGIFDLDTKQIYPVKINQHIAKEQADQMILQPHMILDFAHYLGEFARTEMKLKNVMVKAKAAVSMNGRRPQYMVNPDVDLLKKKWDPGNNSWIVPLQDPNQPTTP